MQHVGTRGFTRIELLVVIGVATILLALATPSIRRQQAQARRNASRNNMKQIAIAMHNYHDVHRVMPPGWVAHHPHPGRQLHTGWATMILPFVEQTNLYQQFDFDHPEKTTTKVLETRVPVYMCPTDSTPPKNPFRGDLATLNYSGNYGHLPPPRFATGSIGEFWPGRADTPVRTSGIFWLNSSVRFRDIVDGTSNTFMIGQRTVSSMAGIWPGVRGNDFETDVVTDTSHGSRPNHSERGFSSRHRDGVYFGLCDGSVRLVSNDIDSKPNGFGTFQKLGSRNDGMVVERDF